MTDVVEELAACWPNTLKAKPIAELFAPNLGPSAAVDLDRGVKMSQPEPGVDPRSGLAAVAAEEYWLFDTGRECGLEEVGRRRLCPGSC